MSSDGDDSPPPQTLAERIARLGLEKEASARPSLRPSTFRQPLSITTPTEEASSEGPLLFSRSSSTLSTPKPPTGPKPRIATKPSLSRGPNIHTAALAQHTGTGSALSIDAMQTASSSPVVSYEPHPVSVQQRVQSLHHTQPAPPVVSNPFASPEMPSSFEQAELPPPPVPVLRRSSSSISRLPLPPPPPLPSAPIERRPSSRFEYPGYTALPLSPSTRHASLGVAAGQHMAPLGRLPLPPPPLPLPVCARESTAFHPPPTLPPKPTNIGALK
ncbi:hypothetical protein FBU31_007470, partial [Coemansia sp. 'formosensis']